MIRCKRQLAWTLLAAMALSVPLWATDAAIRCTHQEMPVYPVLLRKLKIGGRVKLRVKVAPDGKVAQTTIQSGNPMLAEMSCMAVKKWTYTARREPAEVLVELEFDPAASEPRVIEGLQ